jgi:8-oxo-dGTP pyrophosphatase MutT (NUDIX family)
MLLLQRADRGDHNSNAWVFPGGLVDAGDARCHACCAGLDDAQASANLALLRGGMDFYIDAIRECFEETGVLFADDLQGRSVVPGAVLEALRAPLCRGECDFAGICSDHGLRPAVGRLAYIAHWVTPMGLPKRFDTRFFLAVLPPGQTSAHDAVETVDQIWLTPAEILAPQNARRMLKVTRTVVQMLADFADLDALLRWAHSPLEVPRVMQRLCTDAGGQRTVMPEHPAYAEIGMLDPIGEGTAWCELRPGIPVHLLPRVLRLTHRSEKAGADFNTYLVGDAVGGWALVEPGADGVPVVTGASLLQPVHGPCDDSQPLGWMLPGEVVLFTGEAVAGPSELPESLRARVRWIAPASGFLVPVE